MTKTPTIKASSVWDAKQISAFLDGFVEPLRLAITVDGTPLVVPLWFIYSDGQFICASQTDAHFTKLARQATTCGFDASVNEIPYKGVRGQGRINVSDADGDEALDKLRHRYLEDPDSSFGRWLSSRQVPESAIIIEPDWITSWDFTDRMG